MALSSHNSFVSRIAAGFVKRQCIYGENQAITSTTLLVGSTFPLHKISVTQAMNGSLPSGVTSFIPTCAQMFCTTTFGPVLVAKLIDLGNLNIATPTFTDGSNMGSDTVAGQTLSRASAVIAEVTTVLNATPGNLGITYVDQDGNTAEATTVTALTTIAVVGTCAWVPLNSPDWGVRDITTATRTGGTTPTGVVQFWGLVPIGMLYINAETQPGFRDFITTAPNIVKLGINDVIGFIAGATVVRGEHGSIQLVGDN